MAFKIYTKTGDKGTTALVGGNRVSKTHERIEAYGTIDELNSYMGLIADIIELNEIKTFLREIQAKLMTISSVLATQDKEKQEKYTDFSGADVTKLEAEIDKFDKILPPLTKFILPGGHYIVSHIHIARTICRRAERRVLAVAENENNYLNPLPLKYLNRLSDYLFSLARFIAFKLNADEVEWKSY